MDYAHEQLKSDLTTVTTRLAEATITLRRIEANLTATLSGSPINFGTHPAEEKVVAASCLTHVALDLIRQSYRDAYLLARSQGIHRAATLEPEWARATGLLRPLPGNPAEQADG